MAPIKTCPLRPSLNPPPFVSSLHGMVHVSFSPSRLHHILDNCFYFRFTIIPVSTPCPLLMYRYFSPTSRSPQVHEFGRINILRDLPRPSKSLAKSLSLWRPLAQVKCHTLSERSWEKQRFVARPLSCSWKGKLQPLLAINESHLFVAAGHMLDSYAFTLSKAEGTTPSISFRASYQLGHLDALRSDITSVACVPDGGSDCTLFIDSENGELSHLDTLRSDITSVACVPDGGSDCTLFIDFENGGLERLRIPPCNPGQLDLPINGDSPPSSSSSSSSHTSFHHHDGELIEGPRRLWRHPPLHVDQWQSRSSRPLLPNSLPPTHDRPGHPRLVSPLLHLCLDTLHRLWHLILHPAHHPHHHAHHHLPDAHHDAPRVRAAGQRCRP